MPPPEELLNILEYTRAIVKKTWAIAGKTTLTESDRSRLKSIDNDVQYCAAELAIIRDDPENGFGEPDKAVLNKVLAQYTEASSHLGRRDASSALTQEKTAYRILRKFIFELEKEWKPPPSGQSIPKQKPDRIKLGKPPEFSHYEKERVQAELKKMQQKLKKLKGDQKRLQIDLENFLEQEAKKSSSGKNSKAGSDAQSKSKDGDKGKGSSPGKGDAKSQSAAKGKGSSPGQSTGQSQRLGKTVAGTEARLKMFQAKENALYKQVSQLKRDMEKLPPTSDRRDAQTRLETQKYLSEALSKMEKLQAKLTETRYQANMNEDKSAQVVELMEEARRQLDLAGKTLETGLEMSEEQRVAKEAQQMAEQLAADADALDKSLTPLERRQMLVRLEAAKRLLDSFSQAQWSVIGKGGSSAASHTLTQNPQTAQAQQALEMARQFWSIAVKAKKRQMQLTEDEPSDVTFYEMENRFFENAAKFDLRQGKK